MTIEQEVARCAACAEPMPHKHPFCRKCGWAKGGIDSWDGKRCKCGHYERAMPTEPATVTELR